MFFEIRRDRDVSRGGLWYDPDLDQFVEVTDLDSNSGIDGVVEIQKGWADIAPDSIEEGARELGWTKLEEPPAFPEHDESEPHDWMPRPRIWPKPKKGDLFWVPEAPVVGRVLKVWEAWQTLKDQGRKFSELTPIERDELWSGIIMAAEAVQAHSGLPTIDRRMVVIKKGTSAAKRPDKTAMAFGASRFVVTTNLEKAVWKILDSDYGIRKP